jgi:hypothetical protein
VGSGRRTCRRGPLCIAYSGKAWLSEHFERFGERLEYVWTGAIFLPGRHTAFRHKMIFERWRPVTFFSAGTYDVRTTIVDALMARGRGERGDHSWHQTVGPPSRLVEMATRSGEMVLDPFLGSGTTGLVGLRRRFLGCDIDPGAVSLALERLQTAFQDSA